MSKPYTMEESVRDLARQMLQQLRLHGTRNVNEIEWPAEVDVRPVALKPLTYECPACGWVGVTPCYTDDSDCSSVYEGERHLVSTGDGDRYVCDGGWSPRKVRRMGVLCPKCYHDARMAP